MSLSFWAAGLVLSGCCPFVFIISCVDSSTPSQLLSHPCAGNGYCSDSYFLSNSSLFLLVLSRSLFLFSHSVCLSLALSLSLTLSLSLSFSLWLGWLSKAFYNFYMFSVLFYFDLSSIRPWFLSSLSFDLLTMKACVDERRSAALVWGEISSRPLRKKWKNRRTMDNVLAAHRPANSYVALQYTLRHV